MVGQMENIPKKQFKDLPCVIASEFTYQLQVQKTNDKNQLNISCSHDMILLKHQKAI